MGLLEDQRRGLLQRQQGLLAEQGPELSRGQALGRLLAVGLPLAFTGGEGAGGAAQALQLEMQLDENERARFEKQRDRELKSIGDLIAQNARDIRVANKPVSTKEQLLRKLASGESLTPGEQAALKRSGGQTINVGTGQVASKVTPIMARITKQALKQSNIPHDEREIDSLNLEQNEALLKQIAKARPPQKALTDVGAAQTQLKTITDMRTLYTQFTKPAARKEGVVSKFFENVKRGGIATLPDALPYDKAIQEYAKAKPQVAQQIGRATAVGTLSNQDIKQIQDALPDASTDPSIGQPLWNRAEKAAELGLRVKKAIAGFGTLTEAELMEWAAGHQELGIAENPYQIIQANPHIVGSATPNESTGQGNQSALIEEIIKRLD